MTHTKNTILLVLISTLFLAGCGGGGSYDRSSPEALGKSLVEVVANQDKNGLQALVPNKEDLLATLDASDAPDVVKSEMRAEFEQEWKEMEQEIQREILDGFDEMIEEAKEEGVDLSTATFKSVEFETRKREAFKTADIEVQLTIDGEPFKLRIDDAAEMTTGWVMSPEGFRLREAH